MRKLAVALAASVVLFASVTRLAAEDPPPKTEIVKRVKPATALVETQQALGSCFCIDPAGLFITNEHVIHEVMGDGEVKLVLNAGLADQVVLKARVVRRDEALDLALLQATGTRQFTALALGSDDSLVELTELIAFGFPFGKELATKGEYPSVTVNNVNVSSLRTDAKHELVRIQLDSSLNPGNSGGPVVDRSGKVMGVVVSGIMGAGINMAIPAHHVARFLERPVIAFTPPTFTAAKRTEPVEFRATAVAFGSDTTPLEVELLLDALGSTQRKLPMKLEDGTYSVTAAPFAEADSGRVRIEVKFADGSIAGLAADAELTVGTDKAMLSSVRSVKLGSIPLVELLNGNRLEGSLQVDPIAFELGGNKVKVDISKALEVTASQDLEGARLHCTIVASKSGHEVGRLEADVYPEGTRRATFEQLAQGEFVKPLPTSVATSYLKAISTAGDYIGGGKTFDYTGADLHVGGNRACIQVRVDGWDLEFAAPRGKSLATGNYPDARRYPFNDAAPGLSFTGHGRGSNEVGGRFVIWELEMNGDTITRLAVDFIHRSEGRGPPLYGMLRWNSKFQ